MPSAAGGSLMFTPEICVPVMRKLYTEYGKQLFKRYGFADAFNPTAGWVARDVVGIDQGIMLLSAENLRSGFVWDWFMRSIPVVRAIERIGFDRPAPRPSFWKRLFRWKRSTSAP